ncbi:MAG: hypothetical protein WC506_03670 [Candidatus Micrarchaeia archaeon]
MEKANCYMGRLIAGEKVPASRFYSKYIDNVRNLRADYGLKIILPFSNKGYVGTIGTADFEVKSEDESKLMLGVIRGLLEKAAKKRPELSPLLEKVKSARKLLYVDAVASTVQKHNVGFDMLERASRIGRARGAGIAYIESTNPIMDRVCEKNGWVLLYTTNIGNSFFIKAL